MPDPSISITQRRAEAFAERVLTSFGADIEKREASWEIRMPPDVNDPFEWSVLTVETPREGELAASDDDDAILSPESSFFQELVDTACEIQPVASTALSDEVSTVPKPKWLDKSEVEVIDFDFTPYYDRTALVVLVKVEVETVSEFQTDLLRVTAVDLRLNECVPALAERYLEMTDIDTRSLPSFTQTIDLESVSAAIETATSDVENQLQDRIEHFREDASRAAEEELEDYRRFHEERIDELRERKESISNQIEEIGGQSPDGADRSGRVSLLRERKELRNELNQVESKLTELIDQRDAGFPKKQTKIRKRHALDVDLNPVALTLLGYERGEVSIKISGSESTISLTLPCGSGIGITEVVRCSECGELLNGNNPVEVVDTRLVGINCCQLYFN